MRLRTAKDRLKVEHSIIDGVRGILLKNCWSRVPRSAR